MMPLILQLLSTSFAAVAILVTSLYLEKSEPWGGVPQQIPGKVECERYDVGGENVAYHDIDTINNGSGKLNPVNGNPLHAFRIDEGVDISYTKSGGIDDNAYNLVTPEMNQLYVGWTQPTEWINYTVDIAQAGRYVVDMMYTSHDDGGISFSLDHKKITGIIDISSTYHAGDTVAWRQWHHWNVQRNLVELQLPKGRHLLTLHTEVNGNMNYDYLIFHLKK